MIKTKFPQIQAASIYGGETLIPPQYGYVAISLKPHDAYVAPIVLKNEISAYIMDKIPVPIKPIFIDPSYYYLQVNSTVYFDQNKTTNTPYDIQTMVINTIQNYNDNYLFDFQLDFRYSKLVSLIDATDPSIVSNDTTVKMTKRIFPTINTSYSTVIDFNQSLKLEGHPVGYYPVVESSAFAYQAADTLVYSAILTDDGYGVLNVYTNEAVGIRRVLNAGVGTVDYTTGVVTIQGLYIYSFTNYINITIDTAIKDIIIGKNQILTIDPVDVTVNVTQVLM